MPFYMEIDEETMMSSGVTLMVIAHALAIISHEYYYSTSVHKNFEKSIDLLVSEKKMINWCHIANNAVIKLIEINPSNAYVEGKENIFIIFIRISFKFYDINYGPSGRFLPFFQPNFLYNSAFENDSSD